MAGFAPEVPRTLAGRYQLVRLLARGGMAEVWEGRDDVLSRPVAVKVLLPHLAADPQLRERFRREAVTAARLVHPGIVATFDAGVEPVGDFGEGSPGSARASWARDEGGPLVPGWPEAPSTAFIVMELVPGETLRDLLRRQGPLEARLAVAITSQVADALAYAHAQGLVHRDIKPANVLLRDEGAGLAQVKVADFGIAKATSNAGDLTAQGALLGTPKYIAPEQVQGREPDERADLYSLGVVLFEMLAGQAPFQGGADMATALAHVQQPAPRLSDFRPDVPPRLAELVSALLVKDPQRRVPSARALESMLANVSKREGLPLGGAGTFIYLGGARQAKGVESLTAAKGQRTAQLRGGSATAVATAAAASTRSAQATEMEGAPERRTRGRERRGKRRTASAVVGAVVFCGALAAAALAYPWQHGPRAVSGDNGQRTSGSSPSVSAGSHGQIKVLAVREVAVGGNLPNDNVGELSNLISATQGTFWQSDKYTGPRFGNYGGFGLALELSGTHVVHDLVVITPMSGWSAEVFVSDSFASSPSQWGRATSSGGPLYGDHTFSLGRRRASWVLLWMLDPGPTYQATIDKLRVY